MKKHMWASALLVVLALSGCSTLGVLSKTESFSGSDSFAVTTPRSDILDVIALVGKEMGMSVTYLDKKQGSISFRSSSSSVGMVLVGSMSSSTLGVVVKDEGKTLDISTQTNGNYGTGGQETSTKLIDEFKKNLSEKLGQSIATK